jgi:hypothetical protein
MRQIGIVDINKTPSILDSLSGVAQIVNKKTKDVKGFFVPFAYKDMIQNVIDEIEYQQFKKRNQDMANSSNNTDLNDDTLMDGLDDKY